MLQKIISIKNIGRFRNCAAVGDVTFRRITLIFSENGRGKTTFCAILRSLFTNTPAFIMGRRTLGSPDPPEAQLLFANNGTISFRNEAWSAPYPEIAVFDGAYISDNVFAGDFVDTAHRRNLYRVIIGAQGVALAARITEIDAQVRAKNDEIRNGRAGLQRYIPAGMAVEDFIALPEDAAIDERITAKEQELQAAQRAAQLQQRQGLTAITLPLFDPRFTQLLAKTLPGIAADAERRVREHIAAHRMQARGEPWLTEGLGYTTDSCPYCGQDLRAVTLIQAYRDFFNREYLALRDEVTRHSRDIDDVFGDRAAAMIEQIVLQNINAVEFWQHYCQIAAPVLAEAGRTADILGGLRQTCQSLLQRKAANPLEAVPPDDAFTQALGNLDQLRASVAGYNAAVAAANALITAKKQQAGAADVRAIERTLAALRAKKARYTAEVRALCEADATRQREKSALEEEKARVRAQLDTHTEQVIVRYGESINCYLERINAGFGITTPTHTYRGGPPSTSYQIVINQRPVDLGDATTPLDRPSFRNTLSAGDRSTLALAFFLAELEQDSQRARRIVVFDDPFTSLDAFRRNQTVHQIYRCADACLQVVVLSHDPNFLKLLWDRIPPADRKTLQFARVGEENTTVAEWDIEKAVRAQYRADIDSLQRYFSTTEGNPRDIIQKIRPVLEGYCCNLYPTQFPEGDTLGDIIGKIRNARAGHPLAPILDQLDELNQYARRNHHGENPNATMEPVNAAELQGYVRQTLKLVGCLL
ncbi:MAG: AAA family ATPase [Betaproteobacteria bacterium]|nr:AAA family ATPase [Betaproteobacteria bacterium]